MPISTNCFPINAKINKKHDPKIINLPIILFDLKIHNITKRFDEMSTIKITIYTKKEEKKKKKSYIITLLSQNNKLYLFCH